MEPQSVKKWSVGLPGRPRAPTRERACSEDPFLMISVHFWDPFGLQFPQCCDILSQRVFHYSWTGFAARISSILAPVWEAFPCHVRNFLKTGGHRDICTHLNETLLFLNVPGLLCSHILSMFKTAPFRNSHLYVFCRFWAPRGSHFGTHGLSFWQCFF